MPDQYGNPTEAELRGQAYTGYAPNTQAAPSQSSGPYAGMSAAEIIDQMHRTGLTQDGINRVYEMRQLGTAPTLPSELAGVHRGQGRDTALYGADGKPISGSLRPTANQFINSFNSTAVDPFRAYNVGNWLGVAGLLAGGIGAALTAPAAAGGAAGGVAGSGGSGLTTMTAAEQAAITAGLTNVPAGVGTAGAAAGGAISGFGGIGTAGIPANLAADFAGSGAAAGAAGNGLVLSGGAGTGVPNWLSTASSAVGGGGVGTANSGIWDDLIPLAGQLIGSYMEGEGAKDASRAQIAAAMAALAEQRRQYDTSREDQMPWLEAGRAALGRLQDPTAFTKSPGYEFIRGEGNRNINNSFAARGGALSGNALRALDDYNTGLASQEYNNWFNQNASLAGVGQASAQNLGSLGQINANNASNILQNQGNARASGILGQTEAYTNGLNQLGQWYGNYRRNRQGAY